MQANWLDDFVSAPRAIGSRHRVSTQGGPAAIFNYRSTYVHSPKNSWEVSSLVKTVNCKEDIIYSVGSNQATRRWQGERPVGQAPSLVRGTLLQPEEIITRVMVSEVGGAYINNADFSTSWIGATKARISPPPTGGNYFQPVRRHPLPNHIRNRSSATSQAGRCNQLERV